MAAIDEDPTQTIGYKDASITMPCPHCDEEVEFPFTVELVMTATDTTMDIEASIFGEQINAQPLYDHMSKRHK